MTHGRIALRRKALALKRVIEVNHKEPKELKDKEAGPILPLPPPHTSIASPDLRRTLAGHSP
jgi:hypothetical protein